MTEGELIGAYGLTEDHFDQLIAKRDQLVRPMSATVDKSADRADNAATDVDQLRGDSPE